jgi:transposase-like protein
MTDETLPAEAGRRRSPVRYTAGLAKAICARVAEGEFLAEVCREAGMPNRTAIYRWLARCPRFAARLEAARRTWAMSERVRERTHGPQGSRMGQGSSYSAAVADEIFERMCEGESVMGICRDPAMPGFSTVYRWRRAFPDFAEAMRVAREVQAEFYCDRGMEIADAVTPETAHATRVRLAQLRWTAGVMAPARFGRMKPLDVEQPPEPPQAYYVRHFRVEVRPEDGATRVVAFRPDLATGEVIRETPEDAPWNAPPPGNWRRRADGPGA